MIRTQRHLLLGNGLLLDPTRHHCLKGRYFSEFLSAATLHLIPDLINVFLLQGEVFPLDYVGLYWSTSIDLAG